MKIHKRLQKSMFNKINHLLKYHYIVILFD